MPVFPEIRNRNSNFLTIKTTKVYHLFWLFYSLNPSYQDSYIFTWSRSENMDQLAAKFGNGPSVSILPFWRDEDVKTETTFPSLTCRWVWACDSCLANGSHVLLLPHIRKLLMSPSSLPLFTGWKMATNYRSLLGPWDNIYTLRMESHLRSLGTKITSWSNAI